MLKRLISARNADVESGNAAKPPAASRKPSWPPQSMSFGSFDAFKDKFTSAAVDHFGSGWVLLMREPAGRFSVVTTANAHTPPTAESKTTA